MKRFCGASLIIAVAAIAAARGVSFGHAFLDHSDPKVGSENTTAPAKVRIWFDNDLKGDKCVIKIFDEAGNQIDLKDSAIDAKDKTLLTVSLPEKLAAGTYRVEWTAVARDSHTTHGDFKFVVKSP